jgi:hypothetical protein
MRAKGARLPPRGQTEISRNEGRGLQQFGVALRRVSAGVERNSVVEELLSRFIVLADPDPQPSRPVGASDQSMKR